MLNKILSINCDVSKLEPNLSLSVGLELPCCNKKITAVALTEIVRVQILENFSEFYQQNPITQARNEFGQPADDQGQLSVMESKLSPLAKLRFDQLVSALTMQNNSLVDQLVCRMILNNLRQIVRLMGELNTDFKAKYADLELPELVLSEARVTGSKVVTWALEQQPKIEGDIPPGDFVSEMMHLERTLTREQFLFGDYRKEAIFREATLQRVLYASDFSAKPEGVLKDKIYQLYAILQKALETESMLRYEDRERGLLIRRLALELTAYSFNCPNGCVPSETDTAKVLRGLIAQGSYFLSAVYENPIFRLILTQDDHLAAGLISEKKYNLYQVDEKGRTLMHYAVRAQSDLVCMTLDETVPGLRCVPDNAGRLPADCTNDAEFKERFLAHFQPLPSAPPDEQYVGLGEDHGG